MVASRFHLKPVLCLPADDLDNLGISLTAVWTILGVDSVAIALALLDALKNFFAGIYIRLDSPVGIGDYIKLDGGSDG